ncbi:glycosyltransferase, group 1 family protein [Pseudoroseomonas cervicalis ATCC 49957]|uniref:Glycosyltransferase, group 1 family protein n=2 Tax=Teichococcus cervicalis TaxID=204525 RepID=D5RKS5_9PROT|nr:glycosyltransferase, group 1 family protein [Pseudoroseomonas cervicalis ATCC 49957]
MEPVPPEPLVSAPAMPDTPLPQPDAAPSRRAGQWLLLGSSPGGYDHHWITRFVSPLRHRFFDLHADYDHDRSRRATSGRQWLDYLRHAGRGLRAANLSRDPGAGLLTVFPQLALMAGLLKRLSGSRRPIIAWSFNLGQQHGGAKARLARYGLQAVERIIVHSRREIASYAEAFGLPQERFVFVPFSVNALNPTLEEDSKKPFLLAMGSANRDYATLFAAMRELPEVPLVVVAGRHATEGLELPPNVTLRSGLSLAECHVLAQRARLSVVPTANRFSASGQVTFIEAMMFGRCCIVTESIGAEDYVQDGVNGLLVPPGDPAALRDAIARAWEDAGLRQRLGAEARRHALEHWTHEAASRQLVAFCDALSTPRP